MHTVRWFSYFAFTFRFSNEGGGLGEVRCAREEASNMKN
jgi:hypothetical protein